MFHNRRMERKWIESRLSTLGKSKKELAVALDVPPPRINEIIDGGRRIHSDEIAPLALCLEMSPLDVLACMFPEQTIYQEST